MMKKCVSIGPNSQKMIKMKFVYVISFDMKVVFQVSIFSEICRNCPGLVFQVLRLFGIGRDSQRFWAAHLWICRNVGIYRDCLGLVVHVSGNVVICIIFRKWSLKFKDLTGIAGIVPNFGPLSFCNFLDL